MNHILRISLTALATVALLSAPAYAQSRGGSASRGGGVSHGSSMGRSSGMSHSGGSMSHSSGSMSRSSGSYSHQSPSRSSGSYSRQSPSRSSGSVSRSSGSYSRQSPSRPSSNASRPSGSVTRQNPSRPSTSASRSSSSVSGNASRGTATRPGGSYSTGRPAGSSSSARAAGSGAATRPATRPSSGRSSGISANEAAARVNARSTRPQAGTHMNNFREGSGPGQVRMNDHPNMRHRIPPRERHPMPYDRPSRFWHHGPHYFGYRVDYLPPHYVLHHYWGRPYYFCDGLWYRYYYDHYFVCRPPFGYIFVPDVVDIVYTACRIAYYNQVYNTYRVVDENAQTIAEQNRIIAENNALIAQQNADIAFNSEKAQASYEKANNLGLVQAYANASTEYFYDDGVFFTKGADGQYTVIVPPAGALVSELPDDYDTIMMDGKEYYKVDDTLFELTTVDGTAYFQVLGQMTGELAEQYDLNK